MNADKKEGLTTDRCLTDYALTRLLLSDIISFYL